ncbi:MAG: hypothetical protein WD595_01070 [Waddliaceae bacterium]
MDFCRILVKQVTKFEKFSLVQRFFYTKIISLFYNCATKKLFIGEIVSSNILNNIKSYWNPSEFQGYKNTLLIVSYFTIVAPIFMGILTGFAIASDRILSLFGRVKKSEDFSPALSEIANKVKQTAQRSMSDNEQTLESTDESKSNGDLPGLLTSSSDESQHDEDLQLNSQEFAETAESKESLQDGDSHLQKVINGENPQKSTSNSEQTLESSDESESGGGQPVLSSPPVEDQQSADAQSSSQNGAETAESKDSLQDNGSHVEEKQPKPFIQRGNQDNHAQFKEVISELNATISSEMPPLSTSDDEQASLLSDESQESSQDNGLDLGNNPYNLPPLGIMSPLRVDSENSERLNKEFLYSPPPKYGASSAAHGAGSAL